MILLNRRGLLDSRTAVFRVDAGAGVGMGHFMRCRSLALELVARSWIVYFVGTGLPKNNFIQKGVASRFNLIDIEMFANTSDDVRLLWSIIEERFRGRVDCLIIDTYRYSRDDFAYLQRFSINSVPVLVIDDLASRDTPAQAVINPNPLFSPEPYNRQKIPNVMCGAEYTLIRPEIAALRNRVYCREGPIMISLGGGDVEGYLMRILEALDHVKDRQICVSISENCPRQKIEDWIANDPERRFLNTETEKFPKLLAASSLAITGGGGTLWEVYCLGIPSLSLVWVDNQRHTSYIIGEQATSFLIDIVANINMELKSDWLESGLNTMVKTFGHPGQGRNLQEEYFRVHEVVNRQKTSILADNEKLIAPEFVRQAVEQLSCDPELNKAMIDRQRVLIDGLGVKRCVETIEKMIWESVPLFSSDWRRTNEDWTS